MRATRAARSSALLATLATAGCTTFSTPRSARVIAGPSLGVHASVSQRPGDDAAWFWAFDCADACDHHVVGADVGLTYGWERGPLGRPVAVAVGTSGVHPYAEGYVQLHEGRRPFGVGGRVGLPLSSWFEHQLYARYDVPLGQKARLLLNPALFVHRGRSPNGENPGSFVAFVQGVGVQLQGERVSLVPAVSLVAGRAERTNYGRRFGPTRSVFGTASLGVVLHRRPRAP
jgi:hypothetical protein